MEPYRGYARNVINALRGDSEKLSPAWHAKARLVTYRRILKLDRYARRALGKHKP